MKWKQASQKSWWFVALHALAAPGLPFSDLLPGEAVGCFRGETRRSFANPFSNEDSVFSWLDEIPIAMRFDKQIWNYCTVTVLLFIRKICLIFLRIKTYQAAAPPRILFDSGHWHYVVANDLGTRELVTPFEAGLWKLASFDDTIHCVEVYYIDSNMEWTRRLICKHSSLYTSCISMRKLTLCTTITSNYVLTMSLAAIFQCGSDAVALVPKNGSKDGQHHPIGEHHESVKKDLTWHRGQKYLQHTATLLFFQRPAHKKKHPKRNKCAATPRWEYGVLPPFLSKVWWLSSCCKSQMPPTVETIGLTTDWSSFINLKSARNDLQTSQEIMGNSMGFLNESCDATLRS